MSATLSSLSSRTNGTGKSQSATQLQQDDGDDVSLTEDTLTPQGHQPLRRQQSIGRGHSTRRQKLSTTPSSDVRSKQIDDLLERRLQQLERFADDDDTNTSRQRTDELMNSIRLNRGIKVADDTFYRPTARRKSRTLYRIDPVFAQTFDAQFNVHNNPHTAPRREVSLDSRLSANNDTLTSVTRASPTSLLDDEHQTTMVPPLADNAKPIQHKRRLAGSRSRLGGRGTPIDVCGWDSQPRTSFDAVGPIEQPGSSQQQSMNMTRSSANAISVESKYRTHNRVQTKHRSLGRPIQDADRYRYFTTPIANTSIHDRIESNDQPRPVSSNEGRPRRQRRRRSARSTNLHPNDDVLQQETEDAALLEVTNELLGLRHGVKRTRRANFARLEVALRHITFLELELQRQRCLTHDAEQAREHQLERAHWERRLQATLSELQQCQTNVVKLQGQLNDVTRRPDREVVNSNFDVELRRTRSDLEQQRGEFNELKQLVANLINTNPDDSPTVVSNLADIQAGLSRLTCNQNGSMPTMTQDRYAGGGGEKHDRLQQRSAAVRRTQSLFTGLASNAPHPPIQSMLVDQLICNVPEHHYLEDCLEDYQGRLRDCQARLDACQTANHLNNQARGDISPVIIDQSDPNRPTASPATVIYQQDLHRLDTADSAQELNDLDQQIELAKQQKSDLAIQIDRLEMQLGQKQTEMSDLQKRIEQQTSRLNEVTVELETGRCQIETQNATIIDNETNVEARRKEIEKLEEMITAERSKLAQLISESNDKRVSMTVELQSQQEKLKECVRQTVEHKEAHEREMVQRQSSLSSMTKECNQLVSSIESIEQERVMVEGELDQQREVSPLNQEKTLTELETQLTIKRCDLKQMNDQTSEAENRLKEVTNQIEQRQAEGQQLAYDLDQIQRQLMSIEAQINARTTQLEQLTDQVENERRTRLETVANNDQRFDDRSTSILQELKVVRQERDKARSELDQLKVRLNQSNRKSIDMSPTPTSASSRDKLNNQLEELRRQIQVEHEVVLGLNDERQACQNELGQMTNQLAEMRSQLTNERKSKVEMEERRRLSEQELVKLTNQLAELRRQIRIEHQVKAELVQTHGDKDKALKRSKSQLDVKSQSSGPEKQQEQQRVITKRKVFVNRSRSSTSSSISSSQTSTSFASQATSTLINNPKQEGREDRPNPDPTRDSSSRAKSSDRSHRRRHHDRSTLLVEMQGQAEVDRQRTLQLTSELNSTRIRYAQLKNQVATYGIVMDEVITIAAENESMGRYRNLKDTLSALRSDIRQELRKPSERNAGSSPQPTFKDPTGGHTSSLSSMIPPGVVVTTNHFPFTTTNHPSTSPFAPPRGPHHINLLASHLTPRTTIPTDAVSPTSSSGLGTTRRGDSALLLRTIDF